MSNCDDDVDDAEFTARLRRLKEYETERRKKATAGPSDEAALAARLARLRGPAPPPPSDDDALRRRLAALKGEPSLQVPSLLPAPPPIRQMPPETTGDEVDDVMNTNGGG